MASRLQPGGGKSETVIFRRTPGASVVQSPIAALPVSSLPSRANVSAPSAARIAKQHPLVRQTHRPDFLGSTFTEVISRIAIIARVDSPRVDNGLATVATTLSQGKRPDRLRRFGHLDCTLAIVNNKRVIVAMERPRPVRHVAEIDKFPIGHVS